MQVWTESINASDYWLLWGLYIGLFCLMLLVGRNTDARDVQLKPDSGYTKPILALEFRADLAPQIFAVWDQETRGKLRRAVIWDYLFLMLYPAVIGTACFIAGVFLDRSGTLSFRFTILVITLQLIAGLLDAIENYALLQVLDGALTNPWPQLARNAAIVKFGLVVIGIGYAVVLGGGIWIIKTARAFLT